MLGDFKEYERVKLVGRIRGGGFWNSVEVCSTQREKEKKVVFDVLRFEADLDFPFLNVGGYLERCKTKDQPHNFDGVIGKPDEDGNHTIRQVFWRE